METITVAELERLYVASQTATMEAREAFYEVLHACQGVGLDKAITRRLQTAHAEGKATHAWSVAMMESTEAIRRQWLAYGNEQFGNGGSH